MISIICVAISAERHQRESRNEMTTATSVGLLHGYTPGLVQPDPGLRLPICIIYVDVVMQTCALGTN